MDDIVWIPAVPLPMLGWRTDRCQCGKKFRGRDRQEAYQIHWRREHEPGEREQTGGAATLMGIPRSEAAAIYAKVAAT